MMSTTDDEALLLDLLNTAPVENGVLMDALGDDDAAATWATARDGSGSAAEAETLRQVRDLLHAVVLGGKSPDELAGVLVGVSMVPSVEGGAVQWRLDAPADAVVAVRAVLAWFELEESRPGRLRPCGNPECRLFLIDRSPGNRAQWCSMAVCGNRMKARRHYERKRQAAGRSS